MSGSLRLLHVADSVKEKNAGDISNIVNGIEEELETILSNFPPNSIEVLKKLHTHCEVSNYRFNDAVLYIANCALLVDENFRSIRDYVASIFTNIVTYPSFSLHYFSNNEIFDSLYQAMINERTSDPANSIFYSLISKFPSKSIQFLDETIIKNLIEYFSTNYIQNEIYNHKLATEYLDFFDSVANIPEDLYQPVLANIHDYIQFLLNDKDAYSLGFILAFRFSKYNLVFEIPEITEKREQYIKYLLHLSSLSNYDLLISFDEFFEFFKNLENDISISLVLGKIMSIHSNKFTDEQKNVLIQYFIENNENYPFKNANPILFGFCYFEMETIIQYKDFLDLYFTHSFKEPNEFSLQFIRFILSSVMYAAQHNNIDYIDHFLSLIQDYEEYFDSFSSYSNEHAQLIEILLNAFTKFSEVLKGQ
ncbi:hypothetical protein TVAG_049680 [Trichomonas vaginalis G3]|uniref:Uncharacterized protein n=1 Tax=Trichomonas vaginalis (strain ATCC PRA-98 / G3) TaxID=412133 RepID=A2EVW3_TRIV3|nr:hypothetical protein TVAGG3_0548230 [Trichomonas vaginalis G3]EAY03184.1 hypothetical protein TVAG_049680 [Trichomonas vaginalis G3]KAI5520325.1 hypothetical protein TVAGG3_0548230 [Trichomonas vaginalis G3]|eukprot:XP_001315407.1 hypothetical protein [Trichomonas vaginalis G3]